MSQHVRLPEKRGASTAAKSSENERGAEDRFVQALLAGEVPVRLPETPVFAPEANLSEDSAVDEVAVETVASAAQMPSPQEFGLTPAAIALDREMARRRRAGCQAAENRGNQEQVVEEEGLALEMDRLLTELRGNLKRGEVGRKHVFDDFLRGRLVSLLGMGLSVRQAASALGLSHEGVRKELKRNAELLEQVTAARYQAQVEPLLVIVRESRRSWRAATWLVKHLQERMLVHEETPDEKRERQAQENDEYIRRSELDYEARRRDKDERALAERQRRSARVS